MNISISLVLSVGWPFFIIHPSKYFILVLRSSKNFRREEILYLGQAFMSSFEGAESMIFSFFLHFHEFHCV